jgi:S-adenosyl methyltransferase
MITNERTDYGLNQPHPARICNYWLGGKDNFKVDREAGDALAEALPTIPLAARANRGFMVRVARYLATELGIRQFLDIGTGLPTAPNLHEVVQDVAPNARIVYCDNDPLVLVHARALLTSTPEGSTAYLDADLHDPVGIIEQAGKTLDFSRPVAVTLIAILQLFPDDAEVRHILGAIVAPLAPGSALALSVVTGDSDPPAAEAAQAAAHKHGLSITLRTRAQTEALFAGLELVEPGVALVHRWRPDSTDPEPADHDVHVWGGVAVKPLGEGDAQATTGTPQPA